MLVINNGAEFIWQQEKTAGRCGYLYFLQAAFNPRGLILRNLWSPLVAGKMLNEA